MKNVLLILLLLLGLMAAVFPPSADAQYGYSTYSAPSCNNGYCAPTYDTYSQPHYTYSSYWYAVYPSNTAYYYKIRNRYCNGLATLEHDGWLYCRYWHCGAWCYKPHCKITPVQVASSHVFPLERVVVREVPILVAPQQLGTTAYGGIPSSVADSAYAKAFPVHVNAFGRLDFQPATSLNELMKAKGHDDSQAVASTLALVAKELAVTSGKVAADSQQTQRELNILQSENQRILIQGAVAENVAVKALQGVSALGTQNFVGEDGSLQQQGADALSLVITNKCVACHGGEVVEAGIDFTKLKDFTSMQKAKCLTQVASGKMPKNGKSLTDQEVKLFEAWLNGG